MSDISPAGAVPPYRRDLEEERRFGEAMESPSIILSELEWRKTLALTEPHRFELAKRCVTTDAGDTASKINYFALNEFDRFEVAKLCIKKGSWILPNIDKFDLTKEHLIEIARLSAKKDPKGMLSCFYLFPLSSMEWLEIVALCISPDLVPAISDIPFQLSPAQHFELAKAFAEQHTFLFLKDIEKFDLTNEQKVYLAKICIEKNFSSTLDHIDCFALDEAGRFELAKFSALKYSTKTLASLLEFKLPQDLNTEIYHVAMSQDPNDLNKNLPKVVESLLQSFHGQTGINYCTNILFKLGWIKNREWEEIAARLPPGMQRIALTRVAEAISTWAKDASPEEMQWISEQKYVTHLLGYLKSALPLQNIWDKHFVKFITEAAKDPSLVEELTPSFTPLLALPLALMKSQGVNIDSVLRFINKNEFKDEEYLSFLHDIIQIAGEGSLSAEEKTNFIKILTKELEDLPLEQRFELAMKCISNRIGIGKDNIDKFALENEQLIQLARNHADRDLSSFIKNIHKYPLDAGQRLEFANLCAASGEKGFEETLINIAKFNLPDDVLWKFAKPFLMRDPRYLELFFHCLPGPQAITLGTTFLYLYQEGEILLNKKEWETLSNGTNENIQRILLERASEVLYCWQSNLNSERMQWIATHRCLSHILTLQAPHLDRVISESALNAADHAEYFDPLSKTFPFLLAMPLAKLQAEGVRIDTLQLNKKDLKDVNKFTSFLYAMIQLAEDHSLTTDEKTEIIAVMTKETTDLSKESEALGETITFMSGSKKPKEKEQIDIHEEYESIQTKEPKMAAQIKKGAKITHQKLGGNVHAAELQTLRSGRDLSIVFNCGRTELLKESKIRTPNELRNAASEAFQSSLLLPEPVDNFMDRYEQTFGTYRKPLAFEIFASGLIRQGRQPVLEALGAHVLSVFKDTYLKDRYDLEKNSDLKAINDYDPNLLRAWQRNTQRKLLFFPKYSLHHTDSAEDILLCGTEVPGSCQKVDGDPDLNQGLVGYLRNGQTRLLAIKDDKDGRIIARRLLRLLPDMNGKPVLFLEILYSGGNDPELDNELIEEAKQIAIACNCPLTSLGQSSGQYTQDYPHSLTSAGDAVPCEYVDGAGGLQDGIYTIEVVQLLFDPSNP